MKDFLPTHTSNGEMKTFPNRGKRCLSLINYKGCPLWLELITEIFMGYQRRQPTTLLKIYLRKRKVWLKIHLMLDQIFTCKQLKIIFEDDIGNKCK